MKVLKLLAALMAVAVFAGCDFLSGIADGGGVSTDDFSEYEGTWVYSEYIRGQGEGSVGLHVTANGIFGMDTTTLYVYLSEAEIEEYTSLYDSQMASVKSQYRLGLITSDEYSALLDKYNAELNENCAPIYVKYGTTLYNGNIMEDSGGYYIEMSGQKARLNMMSHTIIMDDPHH